MKSSVATQTDLPAQSKPNIAVYGGMFTEFRGDSHTYHVASDDDRRVMDIFCQVDYNPVQQEMISRRALGTGNWFLQSTEFGRWVDDPNVKLLWCPGGPGVGKTVISSVSVDYLFGRRKGPVCFIYFNYKQAHQQNLYSVFGSIFRQLYELKTVVSDSIRSFSLERSGVHSLEMLGLLRRLGAQMDVWYLVVDGLNEYADDYKDDLVRELLDQLMLLPNLKVMVTSRVLSRMNNIFAAHGAVTVQIKSSKEDLDHYIASRLSRSIPFASRSHLDIKKRVIEAAQERFLVAELHINNLTTLLNIRQIRQYLKTISTDVESVYSQIYKQIQQQPADRRAIATLVLTWVASAKRSLYVEELQHALALDEGWDGSDDIDEYLYQVDLITSVCFGLVEITPKNQVQFTHHTVQTFVERNVLRGEIPHAYISQRLLWYLSPRSKGITAHVRWNPLTWPKGWEFPLLLYIGFHWQTHIRCAGRTLFETTEAFREASNTIRTGFSLARDLATCPDWFPKDRDISPIHLAAALDLPHIVQGLLEPHAASTAYDSPLITAARFGSYNVANMILQAIDSRRVGININLKSSTCQSALSLAAEFGFVDIVEQLLLRPWVDVNTTNDAGFTPLLLAADRGHNLVVRELLKRADVIVKTQNFRQGILTGITPKHHLESLSTNVNDLDALLVAIKRRRADVVETLMNDPRILQTIPRVPEGFQESQPNAEVTSNALRNPLTYALFTSSEAIVTILNHHIPYNIHFREPGTKRSQLVLAADRGFNDVALALLKLSQKLGDVPDNSKWTPLLYAAKSGHAQVVKSLLDAGVRTDIRTSENATPLLLAASSGSPSCVQVLLQHASVDRNARDHSGNSPLHLASLSRTPQSVEILLKVGANPNAVNNAGSTPLLLAVCAIGSKGVPEIAALLIAHGADVDYEDQKGMTALFFAAWRGDLEVARALLKLGANPNAVDNRGKTPIFFAVLRNPDRSRPDIGAVIKLLVSAKANINRRDFDGRTPMDYARGQNNEEILELLGNLIPQKQRG